MTENGPTAACLLSGEHLPKGVFALLPSGDAH